VPRTNVPIPIVESNSVHQPGNDNAIMCWAWPSLPGEFTRRHDEQFTTGANTSEKQDKAIGCGENTNASVHVWTVQAGLVAHGER